MSEKENQNPEIKIEDRRRFNPDGTEKDDLSSTAASDEKADEKKTIPEASEPPKTSEPSETSFPSVTFADFILSLTSSAQMNLGLAPNPFTKTMDKNLPQAKQTIDLLGLLAEKTKGNLQAEEDRLLQVILSDLRLRYIEEKNKK